MSRVWILQEESNAGCGDGGPDQWVAGVYETSASAEAERIKRVIETMGHEGPDAVQVDGYAWCGHCDAIINAEDYNALEPASARCTNEETGHEPAEDYDETEWVRAFNVDSWGGGGIAMEYRRPRDDIISRSLGPLDTRWQSC